MTTTLSKQSGQKEVSLFHVEDLASALLTSNWMTFLGFVIMLCSIGYAVFYFKFVKGPRRIWKDLEREQMYDKLHEMEKIVVDMYEKETETENPRNVKRGRKLGQEE